MENLFNWQKPDYTNLVQLSKQIPHALLIHGLEGLGIKELVDSFANFLLCTSQINGQACGKCSSCVLLANNNHPDIFYLENDDKTLGKTKNITIEQVRELISFTTLSPHSSQYKIVLVPDTNLLNLNSANALLKLLEEPPQSVIFFLISHNIAKLLPTLKSRCYKYLVRPPVANFTKQSDNSDALEYSEFWFNYSSGSPLYIPAISDEQLLSLINTLSLPATLDIFEITRDFNGKDVSFAVFLEFFNKWLADLATLYYEGKIKYFTLFEAKLNALIARLNINKLFYLHDKINFYIQWANHPLNYKLHIENLLLQYQQLFIKD